MEGAGMVGRLEGGRGGGLYRMSLNRTCSRATTNF